MRKLKYFLKKFGVFLIFSLFLYLQLSKNVSIDSNTNKNLNGSNTIKSFDGQVKFPHVFETLTHLKNFSFHYMQPKRVLAASQKRFVPIVIGIPTMKRANETYLYKMLDSLFSSITNEDKEKTLIIVLLAEVKKK